MDPLAASVARLLDGGPGLWLAPGHGDAPAGSVVVETSGSTGGAKRVVLHRDALIAASDAAAARLGFRGTWHLALQPRYVAGLMVLVRGLLGDGVRAAASDLADLEVGPGRNCVSVVATQLYRALQSPAITARLARFDAILVGGAALSPGLRARAEDAGLAVIETYGMSETCGGIAWDGLPLPGVAIGLDAEDRVLIGGPTLFSGYLGRPELTRQVLVDGVLRTLDRGRVDGGRLTIEGRMDDVLISGGVNVDLADVRAAVAELDAEAAVLGVDDDEWGARVVLFATSGTLPQWRDRLRGRLPAACLPRQLVLVDAVPRTPGGKPDRAALLDAVDSSVPSASPQG